MTSRRPPFTLVLLVAGVAAIGGWWGRERSAADEVDGTSAARHAAEGPGDATGAPAEAPSSNRDETKSPREPVAERKNENAVESVAEPVVTPERVRLHVRVVRATDGVPIPKANVQTRSEGSRAAGIDFTASGVTGPDGRIELQVERAQHVWFFVAANAAFVKDHGAQHDTRGCADGDEFTLALDAEPFASYWFRIVAREDGHPIDAAKVAPARTRVPGTVDLFHPDVPPVGADASGIAEFRRPVVGDFTAEVTAPGRATAIVPVRSDRAASRDRPLTVALEIELGASIVGTVRHRDGSPAASANVSALSGRVGREAVTDATGRFELDGLPVGQRIRLAGSMTGRDSVGLLGDDDEWWRLDLTLESGERRQIDLGPMRRLVLRGEVLLPDGTPCSDGTWWIDPVDHDGTSEGTYYRRSLNVDGGFQSEPLPEGEWIVSTTSRSPDEWSASVRVVIDGAASPPAVTLRLAPKLDFRGRVVTVEGAPVPGRGVTLTRAESGGAPLRQITHDDGRFDFVSLVAGPLTVTIDPRDDDGEAVEFELASVPEGVVDFPLVAETGASGRIAGRVITTGDRDPNHATLTLRRRGGWAVTTVDLGPSNKFHVSAAPGRYDLIAEQSGDRIGWLADVVVGPGTQVDGIEVVLHDGAAASIHFATAGHAKHELRARVGEAVIAAQSLADGVYAEWTVPAGRVTFEALENGAVVASQERAVRAGEWLEVELAR